MHLLHPYTIYAAPAFCLFHRQFCSNDSRSSEWRSSHVPVRSVEGESEAGASVDDDLGSEPGLVGYVGGEGASV